MTIQQRATFQEEATLDAGHLRQVAKDPSIVCSLWSQRGDVKVGTEEDGASISVMVERSRRLSIFVAGQHQSTVTQIKILPMPVSRQGNPPVDQFLHGK